MDLALSLLLLILSLLVGAAAIGGETSRSTSGRWHTRLTCRGWLTIVCLGLTVVVGFTKDFLDERESQELIRLLERARKQSEALSAQLDATRKRLEEVSHESGEEVKSQIKSSFDVLPKPLILSPNWSLLTRADVTNFAASRVTLAGFPCDIKARITLGWNPDDLNDPELIDSFVKVLRGEPKILALDQDVPEIRSFVGSEILDAIPPPLWAASMKVEFSADRQCAGQYWIDEGNAFAELNLR